MNVDAAVHPTEQTLSSFALGTLDDASSEAVNKHLEQCPDCRKWAGEMSTDSFLERVRGAAGRPETLGAIVSPVAGVSMPAGGPTSPAPSPTSTLPPGLADHSDYEILRELGRGGMGVVYLVQNKLMGRPEVLKIVGPHLTERPGVRDRFVREVQSAAKLQHKNIVTAYTAIRLGESIVFAMEYVEGDDLAKVVKSGGPLPVVNACYFIHQAALGLQHAHERGMVHRDIKPANLIVAREGKRAVVKVLDFGLAKVTSEGQAESGLTGEGQMLGTPDFIAPEQIRAAHSADIRADIYSLGCTFYYLLTGEPPFRGDSLWDVYQAHFSMEAGPLNLVRPEVPVELAALVAKMMAKEPARRFQTPGEVARALMPFFKPGASQPLHSGADAPRVETQVAPTQSAGAGPAPTQPATPAAAPDPAGRTPSKTGADGVAWESLIEIKEDEPPIEAAKPKPAKPKPAPAEGPVRRPPWMSWPLVAAASLFGLVVLAIIITIRTNSGETKIVASDDKSFEADVDGVHVEHRPSKNDPKGSATAQAPGGEQPKPAAVSDTTIAWSRQMAKLGRQSAGPAPYACWTFESDARDQIGALHGNLIHGAVVRDGRLHLDGKRAHMRTVPTSRDLREKTVEAWVSLSNLEQRGGGVVSIEHGAAFDGIVFGEREAARWMAGSDHHFRTRDLVAPIESANPRDLIQMAVVYDAEGGIAVYREGKRYGERYIPSGGPQSLRTYPASESHVLLGQRLTGTDNGFLDGTIEEARLYDGALTAEEVAASYHAGVIQNTTGNAVEKVPETSPAAIKTVEGEPPAPPAAEAGNTTHRALPGNAQATRRLRGGIGKANVAPPFRVATSGLAGTQFIDPMTSWPDPHGFNKPDTVVRWAGSDAFARLTTRAALVYPQLPVSRYVCEVELSFYERRGGMKFCLGDFGNAANICLDWRPEQEMIHCEMAWRDHGGWWWLGGRDFALERRISLKLVVGDAREMLFNRDNQILSRADIWPTDCGLTILSETPDSGVIHRCSLRPLTAQDVTDCGWPAPLTVVPFKAGEAAARLAKISEGYPAKPKLGEIFAVKTTGTPMAWIRPGEFEMGSRDPKNERERRHRVRLTYGYWMAQIEVTQGEFRRVMGANPSRVTGSEYLPVDWVAWDQAAEYCRKLTNIEVKSRRLPPRYEYRLPTEAEWEYACRAGSEEAFSVPENLVWSQGPSGRRPHEVAESQPNRWGLYDMHGNVMEWCFDAWNDYPKGANEVTVNPFKIGHPEKDTFVVRGGAWWSQPSWCSSHWRYMNHNGPNGFRGFRIVLGPQIRGPEIEN